MHFQFLGALIALVGTVGGGVSSRAGEISRAKESDRTSIIVRTYTRPASVANMPAARRTASVILERAGIRVVWSECRDPHDVTDADLCRQPLRLNELLVRVASADAVDEPLDVDTLGFAVIDLRAGGGALATVYADRVSMMAQRAGVDDAELLGRAIAHEVGHLLLGTNRHAPQGLMRGSWSGADLRRNRASEWLFGGKEGAAMRSGIASRFRAQTRTDHSVGNSGG